VELSDRHRRFLVIEQAAIPSVFNFVLNGLIAWALFHSATDVPLWGESSIGVDLLATAFLLPFLTCVIVSGVVARHVRSGKVPPLPPGQLPHSRWFQRSSSTRGLLLGAGGVLFGAVPLVWALSLGQAQPFSVPSFVAFKAVWAAMLAFMVTPVVGWWALAHASRAQAA
jgi:Fe2+ transport system protein B